MDLYYFVKLDASVVLLVQPEGEPSLLFSEHITAVRLFCEIYNFRVLKPFFYPPCNEDPAYYPCQTYLRFVLWREIDLSKIGVIASALQSFASFKDLSVSHESIRPHSKLPKGIR